MYLFFDTEFTNFKTLGLISLGIVSEDEKHSFYAEVSDFNRKEASEFVIDVVVPLLDLPLYGLTLPNFVDKLQDWINSFSANEIVFVADYEGDRIILNNVLSQMKNLKPKVSVLLLEQAFLRVIYERPYKNETKLINSAFNKIMFSIEENIAMEPKKQHHALYDAFCNVRGWNAGLALLK